MFRILLLFLAILLSGCGGGGGGPTPLPPSSSQSHVDSCELYKNRNSEKYLTNEYCRSSNLARLGVSTAYSNGYTGSGVTIAILDSGVNLNSNDLAVDSNSISYTGINYDTTNDTLVYTSSGVTNDQINRIALSNGGSGYTTAPTVTISGDGTGAEAIALLDDNGHVSGIYMTERGSGYTNATITIDDSGTGGSGVSIDGFYFGADDDFYHGTSVASIAAAEKDQTDLSGYDDGTIQGAQIINMSLGTTSSSVFSKNSFLNAVNNNSMIVVAAGNDGLDCLPVNDSLNGQCDFPAALPWLDGNSDLLDGDGGWVVVGSVDKNDNISYFSNRAGVTKNNYIVAPGENILTQTVGDAFIVGSGTSFATPYVSGAMALMIEKYPHLTGKEVAQIFFDTAKDLGEPGIDDVYGNGLIDVYAAFAPIGTLGVSSTNKVSNSIPISSSTLKTTSILAASIKSSSLQNAVAFDDYGRGFNVDLTSSIYLDQNRFSFDNFFTFNYGNLLLGLDQYNQSIMAGYKFSKNAKIMFSYDNTLFGTEGEGLLSLDNMNTFYSAYQYTLKQDSFKIEGRISSGVGLASSSPNSMICSIDTLYALGGNIKAFYKNIGIGYKIPMTIVHGSMMMHTPTGRTINGDVLYSDTTENMVNSNYKRNYSLFYELKDNFMNFYIGYHFIA